MTKQNNDDTEDTLVLWGIGILFYAVVVAGMILGMLVSRVDSVFKGGCFGIAWVCYGIVLLTFFRIVRIGIFGLSLLLLTVLLTAVLADNMSPGTFWIVFVYCISVFICKVYCKRKEWEAGKDVCKIVRGAGCFDSIVEGQCDYVVEVKGENPDNYLYDFIVEKEDESYTKILSLQTEGHCKLPNEGDYSVSFIVFEKEGIFYLTTSSYIKEKFDNGWGILCKRGVWHAPYDSPEAESNVNS